MHGTVSGNLIPQGAAESDFGQLSYDVPSVRGKRGVGVIPNPSHLLESLGMIRVNLSVWAGTVGAIAQVPLDEWKRAGVNPWVIRYRDDDIDRLRERAREQMGAAARKTRAFLGRQMAEAERAFADAELLASGKAVKAGRNVLNATKREAQRRIEAAQAQALMFDLEPDMKALWRATHAAFDAFIDASATLRQANGIAAQNPQATFLACVTEDDVPPPLDPPGEADDAGTVGDRGAQDAAESGALDEHDRNDDIDDLLDLL